HNWTGNRVTCRDWFQLSLKEGLTVFRDQEFTADMMALALAQRGEMEGEALARAQASARTVKRIDDVTTLRAAQFPEDAGPMAHPIRPDSYQEIGNFYTATVYEKGAEVIRMQDRKSTRLNSSHVKISYAVFCLKKKKNISRITTAQQAQHRLNQKT